MERFIKSWTIVLSAAVLISSISGCETTVEVDFPRHEPVIVISSFFFPELRFELCLNEARDLVDGEEAIRPIGNAYVELLQGDQVLERMPYAGDCLYRSPTRRPVPGVTYTVRAKADGYESVEATDTTPTVIEAAFEYEIDRQGHDAGGYNASVVMHDPPETDDWYRMMVLYRHHDSEGGEWYETRGFDTDSDAILVDNQDFIDLGDSGHHETVFFRDAQIDHGPSGYEIRLEVPAPYRGPASIRTDLVIILDHISEAFYMYATTERIHRAVEDNPFAEPVQVASNVDRGFGIFGGFTRTALDVQIR